MKRLLLILAILAGCTTPNTDIDVSGPIVHNWSDTAGLEKIPGSLAYFTWDSSLNYSGLHQWNKVATKAQVDQKLNITGGNMTGNLGVQSGNSNKVLIAMNLGGSSSTGNSTFGPSAYYLGLGHREWGVGTYRLMGFGFRYTTNDHYPVVIGYQETSGSSSTLGDFNIWTRPVTTNTAALLRFKVAAAGNVKSYGPITAPEDVATKGYVDSSYMTVKTFTSSGGTLSLVGTPPKTFINSNVSGAVTYTLPPVKAGATYTLWKIGAAVHTISGPVSDVGKTGTKIVSDNIAGSTITLTCSGTYWVVTSKNGTWTTQ